MSDPLHKYRRTPLPPQTEAATPEPEAVEEYLAFAAKERVERLKIKRASAPTRSPGYDYLLDVAYDGGYGTNFVLVYTFMMVLVRGKNLQPVIMALQAGTADFIQEFDQDEWAKPAADAPLIESIEVVVQDSAFSTAQAEAGGE